MDRPLKKVQEGTSLLPPDVIISSLDFFGKTDILLKFHWWFVFVKLIYCPFYKVGTKTFKYYLHEIRLQKFKYSITCRRKLNLRVYRLKWHEIWRNAVGSWDETKWILWSVPLQKLNLNGVCLVWCNFVCVCVWVSECVYIYIIERTNKMQPCSRIYYSNYFLFQLVHTLIHFKNTNSHQYLKHLKYFKKLSLTWFTTNFGGLMRSALCRY
jgi:hypothetical protein